MPFRVNFNKEPCDVYVGRPSKWSNPFPIGLYGTRHEVLELYELYVFARPDLIADIRRDLRGKILGCVCDTHTACHADFLVRIANDFQMVFELRDENETDV